MPLGYATHRGMGAVVVESVALRGSGNLSSPLGSLQGGVTLKRLLVAFGLIVAAAFLAALCLFVHTDDEPVTAPTRPAARGSTGCSWSVA